MYHVLCTNDDCPHQAARVNTYWSYYEVSRLIDGFTCFCGSELTVGKHDPIVIEPKIIIQQEVTA